MVADNDKISSEACNISHLTRIISSVAFLQFLLVESTYVEI